MLQVRKTLLRQLVETCSSAVYSAIVQVYEDTKITSDPTSQYMLRDFQSALLNLAMEPESLIQTIERSFEDGHREVIAVREIMTKIYYVDSKLFKASTSNSKRDHLALFHEAYKQATRKLWKKPYLLFEGVPRVDYCNNVEEARQIVHAACKASIKEFFNDCHRDSVYILDSEEDGLAMDTPVVAEAATVQQPAQVPPVESESESESYQDDRLDYEEEVEDAHHQRQERFKDKMHRIKSKVVERLKTKKADVRVS